MSWFDETVSSAEEADAFLKRHIEAANVGRVHFSPPIPNPAEFRFMAKITTGNRTRIVLHLWVIVGQHTSIIRDLQTSFKGKRFGLMGVKCAAGIAFENNHDRLIVRGAGNTDGASFWPTVGGELASIPPTFRLGLDDFLEKRREELSLTDYNALRKIRHLARSRLPDAFLALSQNEVRLSDDSYFKQLVFDHVCSGKDLTIRLAKPSTQAILTKRLGALPIFTS